MNALGRDALGNQAFAGLRVGGVEQVGQAIDGLARGIVARSTAVLAQACADVHERHPSAVRRVCAGERALVSIEDDDSTRLRLSEDEVEQRLDPLRSLLAGVVVLRNAEPDEVVPRIEVGEQGHAEFKRIVIVNANQLGGGQFTPGGQGMHQRGGLHVVRMVDGHAKHIAGRHRGEHRIVQPHGRSSTRGRAVRSRKAGQIGDCGLGRGWFPDFRAQVGCSLGHRGGVDHRFAAQEA